MPVSTSPFIPVRMFVIDNKVGALTTQNGEKRTTYLKNTGILQFTIYATMKNGGKTLVYNYDMSKNEDIQQYNNILIDLDLEEGDSSPDEPDDNEPVEPDDPIVPDDSVSVKNPVLKVDISLIEKEYVIEIPSDFIDAGGEDDGGDDNEGGDTVAKPTIVGDAGLDISQPIEISGAGNKTVRVKINTPGKLASLVVKITSSTLEALLPAVGLTSEFDICDEGLKETLSKLGLSATKGATSTTFDDCRFGRRRLSLYHNCDGSVGAKSFQDINGKKLERLMSDEQYEVIYICLLV